MDFVGALIVVLVAAGLFFAVRSILRKRGSGCSGCSGDCSSCRKSKE